MLKISRLIISLTLLASGPKAIITRKFRFGPIYTQGTLFHEGIDALIYGILFVLIGLFLLYQYFKHNFKDVLFILKNEKIFIIVPLFWFLAISLPTIDIYFEIPKLLKIFVFIIAIVLTFILHLNMIFTIKRGHDN